MPEGMKLIFPSPDGVLENATSIVGYEALCYMILDQEKLAYAIFEAIGSRMVRFFEICAVHSVVGACIADDDWGFKTQTQFSPRDMRKFVFPWHKKIVETVHAAGKPILLHSCGHFQRIINDVIEDLKFDGRHSYEDIIMPVEEAYEKYHDRLAILGGIDMDFICRSSPQEVYRRSKAMLERSVARGSYALGTGNSVPDFVPEENYYAMIWAALECRQ
jgi:uroporphyrinogen decarboxylase